jgi:hypothetical protein
MLLKKSWNVFEKKVGMFLKKIGIFFFNWVNTKKILDYFERYLIIFEKIGIFF